MNSPVESECSEVTKRNLLRASRRGTKEMDLILGGFYRDTNSALTDILNLQFEKLLFEDDHIILDWLFQKKTPPEDFAKILEKIRKFNNI